MTPAPFPGVISALSLEARILDRSAGAVRVRVSGMGAANAERAAQAIVREGASALLSWGFAGALDPSLQGGQLIVPDCVVDRHGNRYETHRHWSKTLLELLADSLRPDTGELAESATVIADDAARKDLWVRLHRCAVDMESAAVAKVARSADLPFLAIRAITDRCGDRIPPSAHDVVDTQGRIRASAIPAALLAAPRDLGALLTLWRNTVRARRTLSHVARIAGPNFGLRGTSPT
jgi:adenosylhomocysteine nucleosidase